MKAFFFLGVVALLPLQVLQAGPAAPVSHSHAGRIHSHPLPPIGVGHRHGNSAPGVVSGQPNQSGSISGAYTPPVQVQQQAVPQTPAPQNNLAKRLTKAHVNCRRNDADCNVCAVNVRQQFNRAASGQIGWQTRSWRFDWNKQYPPNNIRPLDVFKGGKEFLLGIPTTHVQGFVRTNSARFPYAGSHSHGQQGGIFLIGQNKKGDKNLAVLMKSGSRHPSGVHVFGQYLAYGENGRLFLKDLNKPRVKDISVKLPGPKPNFGGGVGLVKLKDGSYLMLTTGPGGQDERQRFNRFYQLTGHNGRMNNIRYLGQSDQLKPAQWPAGFKYAENLSMITECGSGDIYAIHATGDQEALSALAGNGYWRLSKMEQQGAKLFLEPVNAFLNTQNLANCSMRATATVHVNPANRLEFYCHGYAKNPKGSMLNVLGRSENEFEFKAGILR